MPEESAHAGELDEFRLREMASDFGEYVVAFLRGVLGDMLGPEHGRAFALAEVAGAQISAGADFEHLLFGNAGRLTKRRVVRDSIRAAIHVAGLEDRHLLDFARKHTTGAFALQNDPYGKLELRDIRNVAPHQG